MTTILLLVSREEYLYDVFKSLEDLECDLNKTHLLCIVNGDNHLFVKTRNLVEISKYKERLTLQVKPKEKLRQYDISGRRQKIADLHNFAKEHIKTNYVFGVEDDTIIPSNALIKLGESLTNDVGMVEGIEMGRWGVPYIGAWHANNVEQPEQFTSLPLIKGITDIDAGGFYCFITRAEDYKAHNFKPYDNNGLGPDIDYSLSLRQKGLRVLADFDIKCIHKTKDKDITFENTAPTQITMTKRKNSWVQGLTI